MSRLELWLEGQGASRGHTQARVLRAEGTPSEALRRTHWVCHGNKKTAEGPESAEKGRGQREVGGAWGQTTRGSGTGGEPWGLL